LLTREGGGGSQIVQRPESLVLHKSFHALCLQSRVLLRSLGFLILSVHAQHGAFICCPFRSTLFVRHYGWDGCLQETVEKVRKGERVPNMSEDQIWAAKHLYDSAYHPDTGRLPLIRSGTLSSNSKGREFYLYLNFCIILLVYL
jgi:hypothetical protein